MASSTPLQFLRPMALPRPSTLNQFLNITTRSYRQAASPKPSFTKRAPPPPPAAKVAVLRTVYPYRITRTPSYNYPIYTLTKAGGNKKLTKLRRIEGDVGELRRDLQLALGMDESEVVVNQLTRQIIVRGHKLKEIEQFLTERKL